MEFMVGKEFMVRKEFTVNRKRASELATHSACVIWEVAKVHASRSSRLVKSSWSVKSSQYNRKRASGVRHTKCVCHIGCSSAAVSGNVVKFFKVRASRSSRLVKSSGSEKSSRYNGKRVSRARHM